MKKIYCFIFCLILNFNYKSNVETYAKSETNTYAKALDYCVFYKSSDLKNEIDNIYFVIPETYFVIVLETVSDECFKVQYDKYVGYVKSSSVVIATFIPIVKTLEGVTCSIKETSGTQIWNKPSTSGSVLTTISAGTDDISYIAMVYGSIPSGGESNLWYYISYTPNFNSTNVYEGYVYSENVTNMSEIIPNAESNPEIIRDENLSGSVIYISSSMKTILVVLIAVPIILLILIILYKIINKFRKNTNTQNFQQNNNHDTQTYENQDFEHDLEFNDSNLKNKINKMRGVPFVKKLKKNPTLNKTNYPQFPTYDSDDDWL